MLNPLSPENARQLLDYLATANYNHDQFQQHPSLRELSGNSSQDPALLERTEEPTALNLLMRWFLLGIPQKAAAVDSLVPPPVLEIMLASGLLSLHSGELVPDVMLTPVDEYMFAADQPARLSSVESADLVIWPNPTTRLLQLFTVPAESAATLDLGSGCGILGILAASHSRHVVASDLNPRAEQFAAFNASLNNVRNLECLTGDTFEPVAGRRFDLILANPPFFVTPFSNLLYCENPMELDGYCRRVVREAPAHLSEGGFFQAVLEWVQVSGQSWQERLSEWLDGNGCDAWVLRTYVRDAAGYASERIRKERSDEAFSSRFDSWMEYYRSRGVEEIHGGILAMRRREGKNWLRLEGSPVGASEPFGGMVLKIFETQDLISGEPDDAALLAMKPCLAPDARLDQSFRVEGRKWVPVALSVSLTGAAPASATLEKEVAGFLSLCDGSRTLQELSADLARALRVDPSDAGRQCCAVVRTLTKRRILHLSH